MFYYEIDENNFIIKKLDAYIEGCVQANYELTDLILTWNKNNYTCNKYKYVDQDNYLINEIHNYAMIDVNDANSIYADGLVVDVYTLDKLSLTNENLVVIVDNTTLTDNGVILYEKTGNTINTRSNILYEMKAQKKKEINTKYINDIKFTDNFMLLRQKINDKRPSDTTYNNRCENAMTYWDEGYSEYQAKKQAIIDATTIEEVNNIQYNPAHTLSREEIETNGI